MSRLCGRKPASCCELPSCELASCSELQNELPSCCRAHLVERAAAQSQERKEAFATKGRKIASLRASEIQKSGLSPAP